MFFKSVGLRTRGQVCFFGRTYSSIPVTYFTETGINRTALVGQVADPGSSSQDAIHNSCIHDAGEFFFESVVHYEQLLMA